MNYCPCQPAGRKLPETTGLRQRCRWTRIFNLAVMAGLIVLVMAGGLSAADAQATNAAAGQPVSAMSTNGSMNVSTNAFDVLNDQYKLVIGDQLSFRIVEDRYVDNKDSSLNLVVTDSGDVQVPYIGRYPAVGKTCKELALALKTELEKDYYKKATVIVAVDSKPRSRGKIYLVGAIGAPGPQDISSDETLTLSKAILRAGGLTLYAKGSAVQITRGTGLPAPDDETKIIVNVTQILEQGKVDNNVLQPGDLIFVPERLIRF